MNSKILAKFTAPRGGCSLLFEDDGKVAYAYLLGSDGAIVSDVWLYNSGCTPDQPEWNDKDLIPFANPKNYTKAVPFAPAKQQTDILVKWNYAATGHLQYAYIYVYDQLVGAVSPKTKPGFAVLASKDGPLAKV